MTSTLVLEPSATPSGPAYTTGLERQGNVYLTPWRPWLTMYGLRLRSQSKQQVLLSLNTSGLHQACSARSPGDFDLEKLLNAATCRICSSYAPFR